jgi:hypothetical protein
MGLNTRAKGNRARIKAIKVLEQDGFKVAVVERTGRFIKERDAFGIGDLLAIIDNRPPLLIQVTCNKPHTHKLYKEFAKEFGVFICPIQMVWIDNEGFMMYIYTHEGKLIKTRYL